jgi:hypothetical protein
MCLVRILDEVTFHFSSTKKQNSNDISNDISHVEMWGQIHNYIIHEEFMEFQMYHIGLSSVW